MKIALSGYYGFDNAGDEALLTAITRSIHKYRPDAEFVVFSGHPDHTKSAHQIRAIYYMNPIKVLREISRCDLLISGGGSIFQDITSRRSLAYYICIVALAKLFKKKVIFYAQGVGPINHAFSKMLMRLIANRVDIITLRDEESRRLLNSIGVTKPPQLITADPVFALQTSEKDHQLASQIVSSLNNCSHGIIGVSVRDWAKLDGYQEKLAKVLDALSAQGYGILFIPFAWPQDIKASQSVIKHMKSTPLLVDQKLNSHQLLALMSKTKIMIGMRLHALIFAASQETVFAGLSYDPKVDAFLNLYNMKPLPINDVDAMLKQIQDLLTSGTLRQTIINKSKLMSEKALENAILALKLLNDDLSTHI